MLILPAASAVPPRAAAPEAFEALTLAFLSHSKAVPEALAAVLAADAQHVRGWAAKAMFTVMLARSELLPVAISAAASARAALSACGGDAVDVGYVRAAEALSSGDWLAAVDALEAILDVAPEDSLAAKLSHALRFMLGDREGMRLSIDRVISRVGLGHRHAGFLLGCKAFALEEAGHFKEAEFIGRSAVDREPTDAWGMHAVSHVHEMSGRPEDGVCWIEARSPAIGGFNNFRFHLFWHLALFHIDLGNLEQALDLYDRNIRAEHTDDFRDIANAASFLQRLEIAGRPVGDRWEELADLCERRIADRSLVFADLHYVMALAGAGRQAGAEGLAMSLARDAARSPAQTALGGRVGGAAAEAIIDYRAGRHADAARKLLGVRGQLQAIGGSNAQRDIFEQIMLDAAVRAGLPEARPLLHRRLRLRCGRNAFAAQRLDQPATFFAPAGRDAL